MTIQDKARDHTAQDKDGATLPSTMREQVYKIHRDSLKTAENKGCWNIFNDGPWDKSDIGNATDDVGES